VSTKKTGRAAPYRSRNQQQPDLKKAGASNRAAKTSNDLTPSTLLSLPSAALVTDPLQREWDNLIAWLKTDGSALKKWLTYRRLHAIHWALKRNGRDEAKDEKVRERVKIRTLRDFLDEVSKQANVHGATVYRCIERAEALVTCFDEETVDAWIESANPISNDKELLIKLPKLSRDRALEVVDVFTNGGGRSAADRLFKQHYLEHLLDNMKLKRETLTAAATITSSESRVLYGDARARLKELPPASIHCVVTSPPFYKQRDFGTRTWWDGNPECPHDKKVAHAPWHPGQTAQSKYKTAKASLEGQNAVTHSCSKCSAWFGELGQEPTLDLYIKHMVEVFREVRRVLRADGIVWIEIGDSYEAGSSPYSDDDPPKKGGWKNGKRTKPWHTHTPGMVRKNLLMVPSRIALALQADGWVVRAENVWHKTTALPESVRDRPTRAHSMIYMLARSPNYYYDDVAVMEPVTGNANARSAGSPKDAPPGSGNRANGSFYGATDRLVSARNVRSVWSMPVGKHGGAHTATFPPELPHICIKASTSEHGACAECGNPWRRVVHRGVVGGNVREDGSVSPRAVSRNGIVRRPGKYKNTAKDLRRLDGTILQAPETLGWKPSCECGTAVIPCQVLDPFAGSGTTLAVAKQLGLIYLGIELNEQECRSQIEKRLDEVVPSKATERRRSRPATCPDRSGVPSRRRRASRRPPRGRPSNQTR
jgi:DNA modification methylase